MSRNRKHNSQKKTGNIIKVAKRASVLHRVNPHAAAIDVGGKAHFVAVPPESAENPVREFGVMTQDLLGLADWLKKCKVTTVAMESTGVYWIPLFEVLEARGFGVKLVDARKVKNVSGRKTDVLDCQWLQELHTFGLLEGAFRPADEITVLRAYLRQREMLVKYSASHKQHIQKALQQMNLRLDNVVSDITGETALTILKAILSGERRPEKLAKFRNNRCHATEEEIAASLQGNFRAEHLFALRQAVELYQEYRQKITDCEGEIAQYLQTLEERTTDEMPKPPDGKKSTLTFDVREQLFRQLGTDVLRIKGVNSETALVIYSETGRDLERQFGNEKRFCRWLGLCPGTKTSGGKVLSSRTRANPSRAAAAFRQAAVSVGKTDTAHGAFYRRMSSRLGRAAAVTATAHKLARIWYAMVTSGTQYDEAGAQVYEERYKTRVIKGLEKKARALGYNLQPQAAIA